MPLKYMLPQCNSGFSSMVLAVNDHVLLYRQLVWEWSARQMIIPISAFPSSAPLRETTYEFLTEGNVAACFADDFTLFYMHQSTGQPRVVRLTSPTPYFSSEVRSDNLSVIRDLRKHQVHRLECVKDEHGKGIRPNGDVVLRAVSKNQADGHVFEVREIVIGKNGRVFSKQICSVNFDREEFGVLIATAMNDKFFVENNASEDSAAASGVTVKRRVEGSQYGIDWYFFSNHVDPVLHRGRFLVSQNASTSKFSLVDAEEGRIAGVLEFNNGREEHRPKVSLAMTDKGRVQMTADEKIFVMYTKTSVAPLYHMARHSCWLMMSAQLRAVSYASDHDQFRQYCMTPEVKERNLYVD